MPLARLEVLVEPFKENQPGPHVHAVVESLDTSGLAPDMGPFATSAEADLDAILAALAPALAAGFSQGATAIQIRLEVA